MSRRVKRVVILVEDRYEDAELSEPLRALRGAGAEVWVAGSEAGRLYRGQKGRHEVAADKPLEDIQTGKVDMIVIPGGRAPEALRLNPRVLALVTEADAQGKYLATICHGPQVLISADLLRGRKVTCWQGIRDDVKNAGAEYTDEAVVVDGNLISSRMPADLPKFNRALLDALAK